MFRELVLFTRVNFRERKSIWGQTNDIRQMQHVNLRKEISRHRFEDLVSDIAFSSEEHPAAGYRWREVQGFISIISTHRKSAVTPSEIINMDESISR